MSKDRTGSGRLKVRIRQKTGHPNQRVQRPILTHSRHFSARPYEVVV